MGKCLSLSYKKSQNGSYSSFSDPVAMISAVGVSYKREEEKGLLQVAEKVVALVLVLKQVPVVVLPLASRLQYEEEDLCSRRARRKVGRSI